MSRSSKKVLIIQSGLCDTQGKNSGRLHSRGGSGINLQDERQFASGRKGKKSHIHKKMKEGKNIRHWRNCTKY